MTDTTIRNCMGCVVCVSFSATLLRFSINANMKCARETASPHHVPRLTIDHSRFLMFRPPAKSRRMMYFFRSFLALFVLCTEVRREPRIKGKNTHSHKQMISRKRIVQLVRTARRAAAASQNQQNYGKSKDVAGGTIEKQRRCLLMMFVFASSLDRTVDRFVSLSRHK